MKIDSISLYGWKSFSDKDGVLLKDLKKINIIIGPNNSGKSNVFRYLYNIRELVKSNTKEVKDKKNQYDSLNSIPKAFKQEDTWAGELKNIICNVTLKDLELDTNNFKMNENMSKNIHLKAEHNNNEQKSCFSMLHENYPLIEEFKEPNPKILNITTKEFVNPVDGIGYPDDTVKYWKLFLDSFVFVDPVRHHSRSKSQFNESDFDGSDIIQEIIKVRDNENISWREFKRNIEQWLIIILQEPQVSLDPTNDQLRFYLKRGNKEIPALLENLGTGVSQLVMLLSFLYLNKEKSLNVFLEEPESNLHPEAVVQLVKIMEDNFKNHSFFITTHSSTLIDQINENWSVHRIFRKEDNFSNIVPCTEVVHKYYLLDELGIRPSQLLQSNLVIWVEGPSDRIYLKKWIEDRMFSKSRTIIEGKHYSFLMYGGSNIANYDLIDDDDYINILKTSRYSIILCDSDKKSQNASLKDRVEKLTERLKSESFANGNSLNDYVKIWVTSGREIENYIPKDLMEKILSSDDFVRKYIQIKDASGESERKDLKFDLDDEPFDEFMSFDEFYAKKYKFSDDTILEENQTKNISSFLSKKKASIARAIIGEWKEEHYNTELNEELEKVICHIKKANQID